jgi:hypothetical protein
MPFMRKGKRKILLAMQGFKNIDTKLVMVVHACNPSRWRLRQEDRVRDQPGT